MECRPVGDLGLTTGGIPDESITVSGLEQDYTKDVSLLIYYISFLVGILPQTFNKLFIS